MPFRSWERWVHNRQCPENWVRAQTTWSFLYLNCIYNRTTIVNIIILFSSRSTTSQSFFTPPPQDFTTRQGAKLQCNWCTNAQVFGIWESNRTSIGSPFHHRKYMQTPCSEISEIKNEPELLALRDSGSISCANKVEKKQVAEGRLGRIGQKEYSLHCIFWCFAEHLYSFCNGDPALPVTFHFRVAQWRSW